MKRERKVKEKALHMIEESDKKKLTGTRKNKVGKVLRNPRIRKTLQDCERKAFEGGIVLITSRTSLKRQLINLKECKQ